MQGGGESGGRRGVSGGRRGRSAKRARPHVVTLKVTCHPQGHCVLLPGPQATLQRVPGPHLNRHTPPGGTSVLGVHVPRAAWARVGTRSRLPAPKVLIQTQCALSHSVCGIQVGCKLSLVFFQYCIMANFYWLLVEGLYLHTLLVAIFSHSRHFVAYLLIGWGKDSPRQSTATPKPPRFLIAVLSDL